MVWYRIQISETKIANLRFCYWFGPSRINPWLISTPSLMMIIVSRVLLLTLVAVLQLSCRVDCLDGIFINELYPAERADLLEFRDSVNSSSLDLHKNWTGPPCIDGESKWIGVACFNWHVIHLVLDGIPLRGSLPPKFLQRVTFLTKLSLRNNSITGSLPNLTSLVHLEDIVLSQNHFTGTIPQDYIKFFNLANLELQRNRLSGEIPPFNQSTLVSFNVSHNLLDGPIPVTAALHRFPKSSFDHNPYLCGSPLVPCPAPTPSPSVSPTPTPSSESPPLPTPTHKSRTRIRNAALIAASAALLLFLIMSSFWCYYRKALQNDDEQGEEHQGGPDGLIETRLHHYSRTRSDPERTVDLQFFNMGTPIFDLDDLLRASAEVLGKGSLGTTYKAQLESGSVVAIKRLKNSNGLTKKVFVNQMQLLGNLKHENLVEIISYYYSKEEKLIVYDFIPDGSLFDLLHGHGGVGKAPLDWAARLSLIKDIAKALLFLHQSLSSQRIPHGNLQSSNIIIYRSEEQYHAKLIDFGFFPLLSHASILEKTPEFMQNKKLTRKCDVYCFGIVILEIVTGKIPGKVSSVMDETFSDLSEWVRTVVEKDWSTDILDADILAAKEGHDEMLKLTEIALECTDAVPEKRPKMSEILSRIEEIEEKNSTEE